MRFGNNPMTMSGDAGRAGMRRRAFSLVEVLLAVFILGIGLIMVAAIFPVGAKWTAESTEESLAAAIAQNAVSMLETRYNWADVSGFSSATVTGMPGLTTKVTANERAYQHGASKPTPATNPQGCVYFWTALARVSPSGASSGRSLDVYILVFRKGANDQLFTTIPSGYTEVSGARDPAETYIPSVFSGAYATGTFIAAQTPAVVGAIPPMGAYGVGVTSGTVFRQAVSKQTTDPVAAPRPMLIGTADAAGSAAAITESIIYAPPADGASKSTPLIYVYQTTLSF